MAQTFDFRTQVQDPFASAMRAVQLGSTLQQAQAQRQKSVLDQQALQQALERQQQFTTRTNKILQGGVSSATAEDFAELSFFTDKDTAKTLQDTWQNLNKDKQTQTLQSVSEVVSALANNKPEIAESRLRERAARLRETNLPENLSEAQLLESQADLAKNDPEFLQFDLKYKLAALPGGKEYLENVDKALATRREEELRPEKLTEQRAKALKAGVEADFAASEAVKGLALKQAQIDNYAADQEIARQNLKINKLNADFKREENQLKKRELEQKLADAKVEREEKVQTKVAEANTVLGSVDAALNNADQILANWGRTKEGKVDPTKPNSVARSATGTVEARLPTLFQSTQDFESLVASFESKAFLSQVDKMRGLGALTEREGGRLVNALGSLDLKQSPEQLGRNLLEIQRELLKAREQMQRKYGVQSAPDRPAGPGAAAPATGRATQQAVTPGAAPATPGMKSTDDILRELGVLR
jgi:hypothetical protein